MYLKLIVEKGSLGCVNVLSDSCIGKMSVPPIDNRFVSYLTRESRRRRAIVSLKIPRGRGVCGKLRTDDSETLQGVTYHWS